MTEEIKHSEVTTINEGVEEDMDTKVIKEVEAEVIVDEENHDDITFERPIDKVTKGVNKKRLMKITAGVAIVSGGLFIINQLTKKDVNGIAGRVVKVAEKVDEVVE